MAILALDPPKEQGARPEMSAETLRKLPSQLAASSVLTNNVVCEVLVVPPKIVLSLRCWSRVPIVLSVRFRVVQLALLTNNLWDVLLIVCDSFETVRPESII